MGLKSNLAMIKSIRCKKSKKEVPVYPYNERSQSNLITCHSKLQSLFRPIRYIANHSIISGHRDPEEQFELYKKGRIKKNGIWRIVDEDAVVTYKDGYEKKSRHNFDPSEAIDVVPYPIDWKDIKRMEEFAKLVKIVSEELNIPVRWGGDWEMKDYPHWELIK